jgi:site-specific recombinase XerD
VLGPEEVLAMLGRCGASSSTGLRNRTLITAMYRAGLRISEALDLLPKDADLNQGLLPVLHGKGDRSRTVGLDPGACSVLGAWAERRKLLGLGPRQPLLCTLKGERMEEAYIRVMLRRLAREAGIEKRVHPHGFRHTHAAELRCEGVDIGIISKQLGHRSIATTARYLDHIAPYAVVEAMRGRAWG